MTCIRKSTRQPTVPPNRRRATYQRGQMGTYYMNLSPGTIAWGLIRLRMVIEMIWAASHRCNATTGATIDLLGVYLRGSNSKFFILGVEAKIQQRNSSMCVVSENPAAKIQHVRRGSENPAANIQHVRRLRKFSSDNPVCASSTPVLKDVDSQQQIT